MITEDQQDVQRKLRILDSMPGFGWAANATGRFTYVTPNALAFLGVTDDDLNAAEADDEFGWRGVVHPDDYERIATQWRHCLRTGDHYDAEHRLRRTDGAYRWFRNSGRPFRDERGNITEWFGTTIDIDEQWRAGEALQASKQQLEQMLDAVPVNILSFSPSGAMTYASKRYVDKVGSPPAHVEDFDALAVDVAHPEDFPAMFRQASEGFAAGTPFVNRFRRREKDGVYRWIEARAQPLRAADGAIIQWYIASIDIEDEMRAQDALRERERMLHQLVETLPAMIDCATPDGEPVYRSQQMNEFLGYDFNDLDASGKSRLDATLKASVHPDDLEGVQTDYAHSLATGEPYARRHRLRRSDGEYRWVETRAAPMRDADDAVVQWNVICLDIDSEVRARQELQLAQERLARASQAASLAELSASIAHEVNQPLAAIVANSHACHRWLSAEPANIERAKITAERIVRNANTAADIVSRTRALFSQSTDTRTIGSLDDVVAETRELLADEAARRGIQMEIEVARDIPPVAFDPVQIQQVLINLLRNGMEAMDAVARERVLRLCVRRVDDVVRTEVRDNGPGIEQPARMFEPFFTTKEDGMGIGLAICRSIVEAHGGQLWAENNKSSGATFAFALPIGANA
jgi:PAS domain S-box-containing protein